MTDASPAGAPSAAPPAPVARPWYHWRRLGLNFLTISILAHVLLLVGAAYFIVQTIQPRRKHFDAGPKGDSGAKRAIEHKVQMQKQRQSMSAPAAKRVTTSAPSKVSLPAMPVLPINSTVTPMAMSGMSGATGLGLGKGIGAGDGGGGGGGGAALSLFGLRESKGSSLVGTFWDFKQTPDRRPTPAGKNGPDGKLTSDASRAFTQAITAFVQGGMNDSTLAGGYFKAPAPLYGTQIFIPQIDANEGPKAFNLQGRVQPSRFMVHYQAMVTPPESGTYHFVGFGDDILVVSFNKQIVLDCSIFSPTGRKPERYYMSDGLPTYTDSFWHGLGEGSSINVEAGHAYPLDIVISEWGGGQSAYYLLIRKDGVDYKKDSKGNPILPLFRVASGQLPYAKQGTAPVYQNDGPVWKATAPASAPP